MTTRPSSATSSHHAAHVQHFSDYLRVLHKRRWTAGLAFLVVFVYGAVRTLKTTPVYEATAQVLIEKDAKRPTSLNTVLEETQSYYDDDFYPTQFKILQSRRLAWRTIEALGMNRTPEATGDPAPAKAAGGPGVTAKVTAWVSQVLGAPKRIEPPPADETTAQSQMIGGFLGGLTVAPVRTTRLVEIKYRSPDPVQAERAANAVVDSYIRQSLDFRLMASKEAGDYLGGQLEDQKKKVEDSENALQRYKETHDAVALDDKENTVVTKLADLSAQHTRASSERMDKEAVYKSLEKVQDDRNKLEGFAAIVSNINIQSLKTQIRDLKKTREDQAQKLGPMMLVGLDTQIRNLELALNSEEDKIVDSIRNDYLNAKSKEESLAVALDQQNQQALNLDRKGIEYAALKREASSNRTLYDNLLQRAKETGVTGEFKGTNIQIVDRAEIPREPVLPQRGRDLLIACLQGLALALALAFGFEYLDNRIKTPDDLRDYLGLPFLGLVPAISMKGREGDNLLISGTVPANFSEAIRAVRTSVIFSSADEGARTVVITSTAPSEGKTLVSSNLAVSLAQAGQRTLVIDGDMRRPRLHDLFARTQEPGLSNVLVGTAQLHEAVRPTAVQNLYLLAAGHLPPNPAELLGSTRYLELIDGLRHRFDWILIDAPPVMAVTDAAIISNTATGVVFVVGAEMTSKRNALAAVEQLQQARAKFIGAVLNRVNLERHSYYYSPYYRKDYSKVYERSAP